MSQMENLGGWVVASTHPGFKNVICKMSGISVDKLLTESTLTEMAGGGRPNLSSIMWH